MKYRRPPKLRRIAKWVGLGLCVVILCLGAWSTTHGLLRGWLSLHSPSRFILITDGQLSVRWGPPWDKHDPGWSIEPHGFSLVLGTPDFYFSSGYWSVQLPLWLPLVIVAIPTAILWHRDRPPRKGYCLHCGYNLTGNESGVCPECGTKIPSNQTAPSG